jgi:glycosyltransferase involved in cell wall biosynthesis
MKPPLVSVVMANYNYGRYLAAAIDSVRNQTFTDCELILVDDGSTDNSHTVIQSYLNDPRIRFQPVTHLGQVGAKNAGVAMCRGEYVAFLDADDIWERTKLEKQLGLFRRDPQLGVVYSRRTLINADGLSLPYRQPVLYRGRVVNEMFRNNFICFSSAVVQRQVLEHVGWFDHSLALAVDYDLWLRVSKHYTVDFVDEPLVRYRMGHGNLSRRLNERLKTALWIMRRFVQHYGGAKHLDPHVVRESFAETSCSMAQSLRPFSASTSARWYGRSLLHLPSYTPAWRDLVGMLLPRLRRWLRGSDWLEVYNTAENDPRNV